MHAALDTSTIKRTKLVELDYMRFIACFAVMIVHISATGVEEYIKGSLPQILMLILNRSLKFTTPVFVFLSGVTGFYGYRNKKLNYFPFIIKRLKKVLIPYLVWCVVYFFAYIKMGYYHLDIISFIKNVILGNMSYHLYFVIIVIQLYLLGPFFYAILKNSKNKILILMVFAVATALCVEYIRFNLSDRIFLKYMFFYILGIYVTLEYDKYISWLRRHKFLIIAGYVIAVIIYTIASYYSLKIYNFIWFLFSFVSIFFVYLVGLTLKNKMESLYSFIKLFGQSSYYIYLMHPLVLTIMINMTQNRGILSVTAKLAIYFASVIPITVISCLVYTFLKNNIKNKIKEKATA